VQDVTIYGTTDLSRKVPVVSFNIAGKTASEVATALDGEYGIMVRPGLQCAPLVHKTIGTATNGTVRVSIGSTNTKSDIDVLIEALKKIAS
jgi:cysteine desulfurase/selenocysteine lyase